MSHLSETPRTDARRGFHGWYTAVDAEFSEKLERELNESNQRIKRLEESENRLLNWLTEDCPESVKKQLSNAWIKYKEAKP